MSSASSFSSSSKKRPGKLNLSKFQTKKKDGDEASTKSTDESLEDQITRSFRKKKPGKLDTAKFEVKNKTSETDVKNKSIPEGEEPKSPTPKKPGRISLGVFGNFKGAS